MGLEVRVTKKVRMTEAKLQLSALMARAMEGSVLLRVRWGR